MVAAEIRGGADVIQLREKEMSKRERLELGFRLRDLTRQENTLFIVNDDVDLAIILDADGVHVGQGDIPARFVRPLIGDKILGVSTHSMEQVNEAVSEGADYVAVGPVFETETKKNPDPLVGIELLSMVRDYCPIPYVAIGGINENNVNSLTAIGCHKAAVISDILMAGDIEKQCRKFKKMLS